jgi:hypothetical protein
VKIRRLEFTSAEIADIRRLLAELRRSDRTTQKSIRAKLRRIGFHISDVSHDNDRFTISDFDAFVRRGTITEQTTAVGSD